MTELILASSSPRRRELLQALGLSFTILKPDIDETQQAGEAPLDYVRRLARSKAEAIAGQLGSGPRDHAILAADTIVILAADTIGVTEDGEILGKPADAEEARAMLKRLRARVHRVCTAFTLRYASQPSEEITQVVCTDVQMRDYSDAEIEAYIATGDPFDKAGSYAIQHPEFAPVIALHGSYSNVVGLPTDEVSAALIALGLLPPSAQGDR